MNKPDKKTLSLPQVPQMVLQWHIPSTCQIIQKIYKPPTGDSSCYAVYRLRWNDTTDDPTYFFISLL